MKITWTFLCVHSVTHRTSHHVSTGEENGNNSELVVVSVCVPCIRNHRCCIYIYLQIFVHPNIYVQFNFVLRIFVGSEINLTHKGLREKRLTFRFHEAQLWDLLVIVHMRPQSGYRGAVTWIGPIPSHRLVSPLI